MKTKGLAVLFVLFVLASVAHSRPAPNSWRVAVTVEDVSEPVLGRVKTVTAVYYLAPFGDRAAAMVRAEQVCKDGVFLPQSAVLDLNANVTFYPAGRIRKCAAVR
jgi:hypothetical protein